MSTNRNHALLILLFAATLLSTPLSAQGELEEDDYAPGWGLMLGISVWEALGFQGGAGYIFNQSCTETFCFNEGVGATVEYIPGETPVVGVRSLVWTSRLLSAGVGVGWYTNFDESSFLLQPEVGLGFSGARISFRFNIPSGVDLQRAADIEMTASGFLPF